MKFDIIIGNPPYQDANSGGKKLWILFSEKMVALSKEKGFIAAITPDSWLYRTTSPKYKKIIDIASTYQLEKVKASIQYFPTIGESIGWFLLQKVPRYKESRLSRGEEKVSVIFKGDPIAFNDEELILNSIKKKVLIPAGGDWHFRDFAMSHKKLLADGDYSDTPTQTHSVAIYHTAKQTYYAQPDMVYMGWKLIINNSGFYWKENDNLYQMVTNKMGVGLGAYGVKCSSQSEALKAKALFSSKLYRVLLSKIKTSGFNTELKYFPLLDLTHLWTDEDLYKHFNLTPEEIDYIETNI